MGVAGDHKIGAQRPIDGIAVTAVRHQNPEGVPHVAANLVRQLLRGLLIGVAVGVVHPRENKGGAVPFQDREGIVQIDDTAVFQARRHVGQNLRAPFVVAADVVGGGDGGQPRGQRLQNRKIGVLVRDIPRQQDVIRLGVPHRLQQPVVAPAELLAVKIGEHRQTAALKALRQLLCAEGKDLRLQAVVAPLQKDDQKSQCGKQEQGEGDRTGSASLHHRPCVLPESKVTAHTNRYYI